MFLRSHTTHKPQVLSAFSKACLSFEDLNENCYYGFLPNCKGTGNSYEQILNQPIKIARDVGFILS